MTLNHSTPLHSPVRSNITQRNDLSILSVSPISNSSSQLKRQFLDQSPVFYMDELVLNMTNAFSLLTYMDSEAMENISSTISDLSISFESRASVDTPRTTSPIRAVDYDYFRYVRHYSDERAQLQWMHCAEIMDLSKVDSTVAFSKSEENCSTAFSVIEEEQKFFHTRRASIGREKVEQERWLEELFKTPKSSKTATTSRTAALARNAIICGGNKRDYWLDEIFETPKAPPSSIRIAIPRRHKKSMTEIVWPPAPLKRETRWMQSECLTLSSPRFTFKHKPSFWRRLFGRD